MEGVDARNMLLLNIALLTDGGQTTHFLERIQTRYSNMSSINISAIAFARVGLACTLIVNLGLLSERVRADALMQQRVEETADFHHQLGVAYHLRRCLDD